MSEGAVFGLPLSHMRNISVTHRGRTHQAPKKRKPTKWVQFKRDVRHIKDKIRSYAMDAFRNAKAIGEINKRIQLLERKVKDSFDVSNKLEVDYRKSVNFKLLLLLGLWILDKAVIFIFFKLFSGAS